MIYSDERIRRVLRLLVWLIPIILLLTFTAAIIFYPEPYYPFFEYISMLSGFYSENGYVNITSSIIMIIGLCFCSIISSVISVLYFIKKSIRYRFTKATYFTLLAIGLIGSSFPVDYNSVFALLNKGGWFLFLLGFSFSNFIILFLRLARRYGTRTFEKSPIFFIDLSFVILMFLLILWFLISYFIDYFLATINTYLMRTFTEKIILICNFIFVFLLSIDDM